VDDKLKADRGDGRSDLLHVRVRVDAVLTLVAQRDGCGYAVRAAGLGTTPLMAEPVCGGGTLDEAIDAAIALLGVTRD